MGQKTYIFYGTTQMMSKMDISFVRGNGRKTVLAYIASAKMHSG
jgi:hypothetical protein